LWPLVGNSPFQRVSTVSNWLNAMLTPVKNKNFLPENSCKNFPEESFYEFFRWESFPGWLDQWFAVARTFAA
jgi:hypothetical protein